MPIICNIITKRGKSKGKGDLILLCSGFLEKENWVFQYKGDKFDTVLDWTGEWAASKFVLSLQAVRLVMAPFCEKQRQKSPLYNNLASGKHLFWQEYWARLFACILALLPDDE